MPIYEFLCGECSYIHELFMKINDAYPKTCPNCNKDSLSKKMSQTSFVLKGEGWYVTDFRSKDKKKQESSTTVNSKEEGKKEKSSSDKSEDLSAKSSSVQQENKKKTKTSSPTQSN